MENQQSDVYRWLPRTPFRDGVVRRHARVVIRRRGQWLLAGAQPDFTIMKADELSGGQPFTRIDDLIANHGL